MVAVRVYNPAGLPMKDGVSEKHPKVVEIRELSQWSEGQVGGACHVGQVGRRRPCVGRAMLVEVLGCCVYWSRRGFVVSVGQAARGQVARWQKPGACPCTEIPAILVFVSRPQLSSQCLSQMSQSLQSKPPSCFAGCCHVADVGMP